MRTFLITIFAGLTALTALAVFTRPAPPRDGKIDLVRSGDYDPRRALELATFKWALTNFRAAYNDQIERAGAGPAKRARDMRPGSLHAPHVPGIPALSEMQRNLDRDPALAAKFKAAAGTANGREARKKT